MKENNYIENKKENKTYISSSFESKDFLTEEKTNKRYVSKVFSMKDFIEFIRNKDTVLLYKTPTQKTEIKALIDEDTKEVSFILQRFTSDTYSPHKKHTFNFGLNQLKRINDFVESLPYIDFLKKDKFSLEDSELRAKTEKIKNIENYFENLSEGDLNTLLSSERFEKKDFVNLAFRKKGLKTFEKLLNDENYFNQIKLKNNTEKDESVWQAFFEDNPWIFGYGLDYRFMTIFDREMTVGDGGTEDQNKPKVDFLNEFNDFTVLVELKTPKTRLFQRSKNRSGAWKLGTDLLDAFSQVLEQKAEWQIRGDRGNNKNKDGSKKLNKQTRDPKTILVIGNKERQILNVENLTERELKGDTFELFRRDSRNIEIITYDELYERAYYIVYENPIPNNYVTNINQE